MGLIDHLKHRLNPKTIAKEVFNHVTDKVIPQGADESANWLFSGRAYLPWPGHSGPKPIEAPAEEPAAQEPDLTEPPIPPNNFDAHAALYGVSYTERLDQQQPRGNDQDRGMSR